MDLYKEKRVKMTIVDLVYFIRLRFKMIFGNEKNLNNLYYYLLGYIAAKIEQNV